MIDTSRIAGFILVFTLVLALVACSPRIDAAAQDAGNRLVYGLTLQPSGFDPHIHASSELGIPLRSVYDTLVYRDGANFVPGLAESWTISPDGLIYTFNLRTGVTFHDGNPFNAAAVAANLDRITNPQTASQRAVFLLGTYLRYEIVDDRTIRLLLTAPYAPFLDALSQVYLGIASPAALSAYTNETYQFHQVGTGPYRFVEYVPGDRLTLARNPEYAWSPSIYQPAIDNAVETVEFRFFTDSPTRAVALEGGDAQIVGEILPADARALSGSDLQMLPTTIPGQPLQFLMNTARFPTDDIRVRQALILATNREAIVDAVYQRFSPIAWGPLSPTTDFYNAVVVNSYAFDAGVARTLLADAGFSDTDNNGYVDFSGVDLDVTLIVPPWGLIPEAAQLIQDQWRDIGIRATLELVPSRGGLFEAVDRGEYNLAAYYEFGRDPSFLRRYFGTDGVNNWTGFSNPDLDVALAQAEASSDPNTRASLYAQIQAFIMEQALILPVRDYVNINGATANVSELTYDAYGWFPLLYNLALTP